MFSLFRSEPELVREHAALPGRAQPILPKAPHTVLGVSLLGPYPADVELAIFGLGCFWGAERLFWQAPGVHVTAVGYAGGYTPNPTYEEVCSGRTGHAEAVLVAFHPAVTSYAELLKRFWEGHDPTQGMRQGNDSGSQYRSLIICLGEQQYGMANASLASYQQVLHGANMPTITTEVIRLLAEPSQLPTASFYFAEDYHQQYLAKNPNGYCGLGGTGVSCPLPAVASAPGRAVAS